MAVIVVLAGAAAGAVWRHREQTANRCGLSKDEVGTYTDWSGFSTDLEHHTWKRLEDTSCDFAAQKVDHGPIISVSADVAHGAKNSDAATWAAKLLQHGGCTQRADLGTNLVWCRLSNAVNSRLTNPVGSAVGSQDNAPLLDVSWGKGHATCDLTMFVKYEAQSPQDWSGLPEALQTRIASQAEGLVRAMRKNISDCG